MAGQTTYQRLRSVVVASRLVSALESNCIPLRSTVFNDVETKKFIEIFKVDTEGLKRECIKVVSNPYLLHCFTNTLNDGEKLVVGIINYHRRINSLIRRFTDTLTDVARATSFNECLVLLELARHNVHVSQAQIVDYRDSYLALENLTMLEEDNQGTTVKLLFPQM